MQEKNLYAVIMAGGKGERFWPQSRTANPKPLLRLVGDLTLIEQTVERLKPLVIPENIIIITNQDYVAPMQSLMSFIPFDNIIGEPVGKDTAPCVALAAGIVSARTTDKNAVMIVLPADHVIKDNNAFVQVLKESAEAAVSGKIITIGVNPTYPGTGFGYIHCGNKISTKTTTAFYELVGFKEKPDLETAKKFVADKSYKWNSGIFIWSVSTIMNALSQHSAELAKNAECFRKAASQGANALKVCINSVYPEMTKVSIDYAIMEKVKNSLVAECSFYWDDVGSWTALKNQIRPSENNNIVRGLFYGLGAENCIIVGDSNHLISAIDVKDMIIVHTEDVTMICHTQSAQRIKELVHELALKPEFARFL